ncbi:MAG: hypothetical protein AAFV01_05145, partial [Bacteroidota bacterium]
MPYGPPVVLQLHPAQDHGPPTRLGRLQPVQVVPVPNPKIVASHCQHSTHSRSMTRPLGSDTLAGP